MNLSELTPEEATKLLNEYVENNSSDIEGFLTDRFSDGVYKTVSEETVKNWLSSPDQYQKELENLSIYYYLSNPGIFQLYDLAVVLPNLNYKLNSFDLDETDDYLENKKLCKKSLKLVKHKQLTRDLISQTTSAGTLCGLWVGTRSKPYLYVFNDLEYVFPAYRKNGEWAVWLDMAWLDTMSELERNALYDNLKPHLTENDYNLYSKDTEKYRYLEFPLDKSVCLRTHTLFRNQRLGVPWATQAFFDTLHKEKLKMLEKSISNKVINSVIVLTYGESDKDSELYHYSKIAKKKNKVYYSVKKAIEKNNDKQGSTVIGKPHWVDLEFPSMKTDGLDPKKFTSINNDINTATNGMNNIINGSSNYSAGKLTLDIMYKKIGVLLEQVEQEAYQKLFNWILKKKYEDDYSIEYDKQTPLSTKEKMDVLQKLNSTFGFSLKAVIDQIDGVDFDSYIQDSIYEQDELKLPEKIQPYSNAYTQNGNSEESTAGRTSTDDTENPSTEQTKTGDGNSNPKPSDKKESVFSKLFKKGSEKE